MAAAGAPSARGAARRSSQVADSIGRIGGAGDRGRTGDVQLGNPPTNLRVAGFSKDLQRFLCILNHPRPLLFAVEPAPKPAPAGNRAPSSRCSFCHGVDTPVVALRSAATWGTNMCEATSSIGRIGGRLRFSSTLSIESRWLQAPASNSSLAA